MNGFQILSKIGSDEFTLVLDFLGPSCHDLNHLLQVYHFPAVGPSAESRQLIHNLQVSGPVARDLPNLLRVLQLVARWENSTGFIMRSYSQDPVPDKQMKMNIALCDSGSRLQAFKDDNGQWDRFKDIRDSVIDRKVTMPEYLVNYYTYILQDRMADQTGRRRNFVIFNTNVAGVCYQNCALRSMFLTSYAVRNNKSIQSLDLFLFPVCWGNRKYALLVADIHKQRVTFYNESSDAFVCHTSTYPDIDFLHRCLEQVRDLALAQFSQNRFVAGGRSPRRYDLTGVRWVWRSVLLPENTGVHLCYLNDMLTAGLKPCLQECNVHRIRARLATQLLNGRVHRFQRGEIKCNCPGV